MVNLLSCDVLVVGAGPAGSSTAAKCSEEGLNTIFIDKKDRIGDPVQCAEAIGRYLIPYLPFRLPKRIFRRYIKGIEFVAGDISIIKEGPQWDGYSISRRILDKWLAERAEKKGAELIINAELVKLEIKNDCVVATIKKDGEKVYVKAKVVVGADGAKSKVVRELGFKRLNRKCGVVVGWQFDNVNLENPDYDQIYLGNFAPGAYGYVFPISDNSANIGVATILNKNKIYQYFEKFVNSKKIRTQINNAQKIEEKSGHIPFLDFCDRWVYKNILLVGDAANQNIKPFGEGILPSIICGDIAGKAIFEHLSKCTPLSIYETYVKNKLGDLFEYSKKSTEVLSKLGKYNDMKFDIIRLGIFAQIFCFEELEMLINKEIEELIGLIKNGTT